MTTTYNEKRAIGRARRIDRTISVIAADQRRADAAPGDAQDPRGVLADALDQARAATANAQRELRIAEAERTRTARALEYDLRPMTLDEASRARLRADNASADAVVTAKRRALDGARTLSDAVTTIAASIGALDPEGASRLTMTLAMWQLAAVRDQRGERGKLRAV